MGELFVFASRHVPISTLNAVICLALLAPLPPRSSHPAAIRRHANKSVQLRLFSWLSTLNPLPTPPTPPPPPAAPPAGHKRPAACVARTAGWEATSLPAYHMHHMSAAAAKVAPHPFKTFLPLPLPHGSGDPVANYMFTAGKAKCKRKHTLTWPTHTIFSTQGYCSTGTGTGTDTVCCSRSNSSSTRCSSCC